MNPRIKQFLNPLKTGKALFLVLLFLSIFGIFSVEIRDPDFWWHLKTGEHICQTQSIPEADPFAYTSYEKDPLNPESKRIKFILSQYWISQVIFYLIFERFGLDGVIYLRAFILTSLMLLIYLAARREQLGTYSAAILLIPAIIVFSTFAGERPRLFSFLFSFLIVFLIEGFRQNPSRKTYLIPLPFVMLAWANMHGGFIVGSALIVVYMFCEWWKFTRKKVGSSLEAQSLKWFLLAGAASLLLCFVNPNTYTVIPFLLELEASQYKTQIIEFMSPLILILDGFYEPQLITYLILAVFSWLVLLLNIRKLDMTDVSLLLGVTVFSLSASRFLPFFTPVALLIIARYGGRFLNNVSSKEKYTAFRTNAGILSPFLLSIALIIIINNAPIFRHGVKPNKFPEGAAQFLRENRISGNMFNPYVWGGYLMWSLYPDYKVFVDGRGLIPEVFFQSLRILNASKIPIEGLPEWKAFLDTYRIDFIVTFSVDNFSGALVPLIPALLNDSAWHLVYMDNISLVFLRESTQNMKIKDRFSLPKEWAWNEVAVEASLKAQNAANNAYYYITMGDALFKAKNLLEAQNAYFKALQIKPESDLARKRLDLLKSYGYE